MSLEESEIRLALATDSVERSIQTVRSFSRSAWVELVRHDQFERWQRGQRIDAETYFELMPELREDREDALVLICGEAHLRHGKGEPVSLPEYQQRFPELAADLARLFEFDRILGPPSTPVHEQSVEPAADDFSLPGFAILRELGRGGSGVVYLARQISVDRLVAIKVIAAGAIDPKRLNRQRQEAAILSRLRHPSVVQIHDVIESGGTLCSVIEYVDGPTLGELTAGKPLAPAEAARLVRVLAAAVDAVHEAGILHRDLKPSNVLLTSQGELKITDFGLAKLLVSDNRLTTENCLLGTPSYMPPEQASGDGRAATREGDVYSLGAILYELLTGRPPFLGVTVFETLSLIRDRSPVPPRTLQPRTPRDLETICLKCLDKIPERRYPTAAALAADLKRFFERSPILARRPPWREKVWRWCRRNPAVATLAASLALAVMGGFIGVVWQWGRAESALRSESVARSAAIERAREVEAGLERLKLANGFLDRGYAFVEWRRWDDAEFCFTKAIELRPDHVPAWEARGRSLYARLGLWDLAAADSLKSFQLQEPTVAGGRRWWWHALLRLRENDVAGYKQMCARMLKRFQGGEREGVSCDFARALLLLPATADIKLLIDLAEIPTSNASRDASYYYIQAIAQYRAGNYEAAIARCRQSLAADVNTFRPELNNAILAMAQKRLNQADEARKSYDQLATAMRYWMDQRYADGPDAWSITLGATGIWPVSCWDWLECEHYMREAADTLGIKPPEVDPRSHVLRARAFAGLRRSSNAIKEYDEALRQMPDDIQVRLEAHRARALYQVHVKDYRAAAAEFGKASALKPDDARLMDAEAVTLAVAGEMDAYRQACARMMDRFGSSSDSETANEVTNACVIRPDALLDMNRLIPLARVAATHYVGSVRMLGSAQYRAGQYHEAIVCFDEAAKLGRVTPFDWYFLAMAHYRLGRADEARRMLATAADWIDKADHPDPSDLTRTGPNWGGWDEKVSVPILRSEAETLVLGTPATKGQQP